MTNSLVAADKADHNSVFLSALHPIDSSNFKVGSVNRAEERCEESDLCLVSIRLSAWD